jgi:hypothetical protein
MAPEVALDGSQISEDTDRRAPIATALCEGDDRTDVIQQSPSEHKHGIFGVVLTEYQVPSISFAPSSLMSLMALGRITGLVVDCGHLETTALPVRVFMSLYGTERDLNLSLADLFSPPALPPAAHDTPRRRTSCRAPPCTSTPLRDILPSTRHSLRSCSCPGRKSCHPSTRRNPHTSGAGHAPHSGLLRRRPAPGQRTRVGAGTRRTRPPRIVGGWV